MSSISTSNQEDTAQGADALLDLIDFFRAVLPCLAWFAVTILITIQIDEYGNSLITGHKSLMLCVIISWSMFIVSFMQIEAD